MGMPFGLKSEPEKFQRVMDVILAAVKCHSVLVYFDDFVVFPKKTNNPMVHS